VYICVYIISWCILSITEQAGTHGIQEIHGSDKQYDEEQHSYVLSTMERHKSCVSCMHGSLLHDAKQTPENTS